LFCTLDNRLCIVGCLPNADGRLRIRQWHISHPESSAGAQFKEE
jgi:hypothetical protein